MKTTNPEPAKAIEAEVLPPIAATDKMKADAKCGRQIASVGEAIRHLENAARKAGMYGLAGRCAEARACFGTVSDLMFESVAEKIFEQWSPANLRIKASEEARRLK